jgi:hypothetical protein
MLDVEAVASVDATVAPRYPGKLGYVHLWLHLILSWKCLFEELVTFLLPSLLRLLP